MNKTIKILLFSLITGISFSLTADGLEPDASEVIGESIGQGLNEIKQNYNAAVANLSQYKQQKRTLLKQIAACGYCSQREQLIRQLRIIEKKEKHFNAVINNISKSFAGKDQNFDLSKIEDPSYAAKRLLADPLGIPVFAVSPQQAHERCEYLQKLYRVCEVFGNEVGCRDAEEPYITCRNSALRGEKWLPDQKTLTQLKHIEKVSLKDCGPYSIQYRNCLNHGRRSRLEGFIEKCKPLMTKADQCEQDNKDLLVNQLPEYKDKIKPPPDWSAYVETGLLPSGVMTHAHKKCYDLYQAMRGKAPIPDHLESWEVQSAWIKCEDKNAEGAGLELRERRKKRSNH